MCICVYGGGVRVQLSGVLTVSLVEAGLVPVFVLCTLVQLSFLGTLLFPPPISPRGMLGLKVCEPLQVLGIRLGIFNHVCVCAGKAGAGRITGVSLGLELQGTSENIFRWLQKFVSILIKI